MRRLLNRRQSNQRRVRRHGTLVIALVACWLGLGAAATIAASIAAAPTGSYRGKTSHGLTVAFKIAGGKVKGFTLRIHAQCISVAAMNGYLDPVLHSITPPAVKLSGTGRFKAEYLWPDIQYTHAKVDGRVSGKSASGHFSISYDTNRGSYVYSCQEQGTWKATRR